MDIRHPWIFAKIFYLLFAYLWVSTKMFDRYPDPIYLPPLPPPPQSSRRSLPTEIQTCSKEMCNNYHYDDQLSKLVPTETFRRYNCDRWCTICKLCPITTVKSHRYRVFSCFLVFIYYLIISFNYKIFNCDFCLGVYEIINVNINLVNHINTN